MVFGDRDPVSQPGTATGAQCRAGYARGSQFVFSQHCKAMRSVGCSEEQVKAIPSWPVATCFSPAERAALADTDGSSTTTCPTAS